MAYPMALPTEDKVIEMPYSQYKQHYSDCKTVPGSFDRHINGHGVAQGRPTIKVIVPAGRMKNSGVRGQRFHTYWFTDGVQTSPAYRAVSPGNARKRFLADFPDRAHWTC